MEWLNNEINIAGYGIKHSLPSFFLTSHISPTIKCPFVYQKSPCKVSKSRTTKDYYKLLTHQGMKFPLILWPGRVAKWKIEKCNMVFLFLPYGLVSRVSNLWCFMPSSFFWIEFSKIFFSQVREAVFSTSKVWMNILLSAMSIHVLKKARPWC